MTLCSFNTTVIFSPLRHFSLASGLDQDLHSKLEDKSYLKSIADWFRTKAFQCSSAVTLAVSLQQSEKNKQKNLSRNKERKSLKTMQKVQYNEYNVQKEHTRRSNEVIQEEDNIEERENTTTVKSMSYYPNATSQICRDYNRDSWVHGKCCNYRHIKALCLDFKENCTEEPDNCAFQHLIATDVFQSDIELNTVENLSEDSKKQILKDLLNPQESFATRFIDLFIPKFRIFKILFKSDSCLLLLTWKVLHLERIVHLSENTNGRAFIKKLFTLATAGNKNLFIMHVTKSRHLTEMYK